MRPADGVVRPADGVVRHADGVAGHADGIAGHADGIAGHADGIARHADGLAHHADDIARHADDAACHTDDAGHHAEDAARHADGVARHAGEARHADGVARHADGIAGQADGVPCHKMAYHPTRNALFCTLAATLFCIVKWSMEWSKRPWNSQNPYKVSNMCVEWHILRDIAEMSMKLSKPPHIGSKQLDMGHRINHFLTSSGLSERVNEQTNERSGVHKWGMQCGASKGVTSASKWMSEYRVDQYLCPDSWLSWNIVHRNMVETFVTCDQDGGDPRKP